MLSGDLAIFNHSSKALFITQTLVNLIDLLDNVFPLISFNSILYFLKNKNTIQKNMLFSCQQMKGGVSYEYLENKEIPDLLDFLYNISEFLNEQAKALKSRD